ncbi:MAG: hypothetical protein IJX20_00310 [Alphaproteobacteria bacterium]|nr:hypothetical protein [Alphaproteobacteria bacterium]
MTDIKSNDFLQTNEALADLTAALLHLSETAEQKKQELSVREKNQQTELKNKNDIISTLTNSCTDIISNIDSIINRMDKVLENNGSSNSNNK